ncbi:MAG: hypothetical protein O7A04_03845 [Acidobacteria bacterium]|nr:hypothetical protein [Acidobacteriota bacterium]
MSGEKLAHLWGLPPEKMKPKTGAVRTCLAVGIKGPKGNPIEKDRFHVVEGKTRQRLAQGGRKIEYRRHDREFEAFNSLPADDRRIFYAHLIHHDEKELWHPGYYMHRAQRSSGLVNPAGNKPSCHGNGIDAQRWIDGKYQMIDCPGEGCPFRDGDQPACKPRARFWFRPVWKPTQGQALARYLPDATVKQLLGRPMMRLQSQGDEARDTFAGMLKEVRDLAEPLGIEIRSWFGLPFSMALGEGSNPEKGTRWPTITFTLDGDWLEWIQWQAGQFQQLAEAPTVLALGSASPDELDAETVGDDHAAVVPVTTSTSKPAARAVADPAPAPAGDVVDVEPVASDEVEKERTNVEFIGGWMAESGYDKRKALVTDCLRDTDPQLINSRMQWYMIDQRAPRDIIVAALETLPSLK